MCYADVIYLDFAKAFDEVDYGLLLLEMEKCEDFC